MAAFEANNDLGFGLVETVFSGPAYEAVVAGGNVVNVVEAVTHVRFPADRLFGIVQGVRGGGFFQVVDDLPAHSECAFDDGGWGEIYRQSRSATRLDKHVGDFLFDIGICTHVQCGNTGNQVVAAKRTFSKRGRAPLRVLFAVSPHHG